jgi:hypothetical protein
MTGALSAFRVNHDSLFSGRELRRKTMKNSKKLVVAKETFRTLTLNQLAAVPSGAAAGDEMGAAGTTWTVTL